MSVSLFIASLSYSNSAYIGYIQFWKSYLSQIFWRHSRELCTLNLNNFRFLVCLSVWLLPHFFTENRLSVIFPVLDELFFSNFLETFQGFQITSMSVSIFITPLLHWKYVISDTPSSGWAIFLKFSSDILGMFTH